MKIHQLHYLEEVARNGLNVTAAAQALHTSQPGVSKQIRLLEEELGVDIFRREGKQFTAITAPGLRVLHHAGRVLAGVENIRRVAGECRDAGAGTLSIATTHTQARYTLPQAVERFRQQFPRVTLHIQQSTPQDVARRVAEGEADLGMASEALEQHPELTALPAFRWNRVLLVPEGHALDRPEAPTLQELAAHPLITYTQGFTGRAKVDQAFAALGLKPDLVLTAADADVIKTYVRLGLGVGIAASIACDPAGEDGLKVLSLAAHFEPSTTCIAFRHGAFLRGFTTDLIQCLAPHWEPAAIAALDALPSHAGRRQAALEHTRHAGLSPPAFTDIARASP